MCGHLRPFLFCSWAQASRVCGQDALCWHCVSPATCLHLMTVAAPEMKHLMQNPSPVVLLFPFSFFLPLTSSPKTLHFSPRAVPQLRPLACLLWCPCSLYLCRFLSSPSGPCPQMPIILPAVSSSKMKFLPTVKPGF